MKTPYQQLLDIIDTVVINYRSDMRHDEKLIEQNKGKPWVHVAYESGTHMYVLPETIIDNSPIKYLFGSKRPSDIYIDLLAVIETHSFNGTPEQDDETWTYYDGNVVRLVKRSRAIEVYSEAVTEAVKGWRCVA